MSSTAAGVVTTRALVTAGAGLAAARLLTRASRRLPADVRRPWERHNHAGAAVTLLEGPVSVGAATLAVAIGSPSPSSLIVVVAPGLLGGLDDLTGDTRTKGLRGHLGALRSGRVTTGALKVVGLGATAACVALLEGTSPSSHGPGAGRLGRALVDTVVIAGTANLVNLLDLRPGRALKVTTAAGTLLLAPPATRPLAAGLVGVGGGVLPEDLAGESMLGDCGANALGGLLGLALVRGLAPGGRLGAAALVTGLTLLSERVSFTRVIESTPVLREIDAWGRRR